MPPKSFTQRPSRVAALLFVLLTIYLIFAWTPQRKPRSYAELASSAHIEPKPTLTGNDVEGWEQPVTKPEEILKDAYKLPTADSFVPHFQAVLQLEGMSMEHAKDGCSWLSPGEVDFQFGTDSDWVNNDRSDDELQERRAEWHNFVQNDLLPYETYKDHFKEDRGIVIVAGNQQSMLRVRVIIGQLKRLKSKLPIEIHYWGDELSDKDKKEIDAMWPLLYFNDLSAKSWQNIVQTNHDRFYINYQLKPAAVLNSRFAEPLLLDSDNIPIIDPEELYKSRLYKEYGTIFWPDIAHTRQNNPIWAITNTQCRTDEYEQESGQMIVDKRRYFYHLQLAAWFNNKVGDYYNEFLLGDKDTFRFAWHALKTPYGKPIKWLTSVGTLSPDGYYCGHSFAQHHPDPDDGRIAFLHGGLIKTLPAEVIRWHREDRGGIFQAYKRSEFDQRHMVNVKVSIKWDPVDYLPAERKPDNMAVASCTDIEDVTPRPLEELLPGFEKVFDSLGGYWMLDEANSKPEDAKSGISTPPVTKSGKGGHRPHR